ncbi:MBL fold hydrolase [Candidatus Wirthbacteria bacterium CG2_30_54_11]|uniref:MBL fold hydrolase n=1 Tax=Candidatus Wirthbacteria bacterium CG2_30_54_11 TaxID=1817892 RepID=A0A1J5J066_9BACT|nr:MAG: MBL fold hydrolase [Candidatus Wirthbacteria bacterium CG2_30_54_11]
MTPEELKPGISSVGAKDFDRRLFDSLIPLPDGTTYNAYVVRGSEKNALIDTVDPSKTSVLVENLEALGQKIDFVICNHAEQDHSGSLPVILGRYPKARIVTNEKCKALLIEHLDLKDERFDIVADGDTLSLGDRTLRFILLPWVHWPETMATYLEEDHILFSCDLLGSHLAQEELLVVDEGKNLTSAKRYYAEIMMPFRNLVKKNLDKLAPLTFDLIAPSHGPVYDHPDLILEAYRDWTSETVKNRVLLAYVSMHGSTRLMAEHLHTELSRRNIEVDLFDLAETDLSELAMAAVEAATIVLAAPTVLTQAHPAMVSAAYLINALKPKARFAALMGSYGWGGKAAEQLTGMLSGLKVTQLGSVFNKGIPKTQDYAAITELAQTIADRHREIGILA